jgi:hypothetical protein
MKMVAEYMEKALHFEQMAERESDEQLKGRFLDQAKAYRKLAADRVLKDPLAPMTLPPSAQDGH